MSAFTENIAPRESTQLPQTHKTVRTQRLRLQKDTVPRRRISPTLRLSRTNLLTLNAGFVDLSTTTGATRIRRLVCLVATEQNNASRFAQGLKRNDATEDEPSNAKLQPNKTARKNATVFSCVFDTRYTSIARLLFVPLRGRFLR